MRRSASRETAGTRLRTTPASSRSGLVASQTSSITSATPPMPRRPSADGSTTSSACLDAVSALRVRLPSEGGQSTRIASYRCSTVASALRSRLDGPASRPWSRKVLGSTSMRSDHADRRTMSSRPRPLVASTSNTDSAWGSGSSPRTQDVDAWGSRSTTSTRRPAAAAAEANPSVTVVLPTPPFWFTIARVRRMRSCCHAWPEVPASVSSPRRTTVRPGQPGRMSFTVKLSRM